MLYTPRNIQKQGAATNINIYGVARVGKEKMLQNVAER